MEGDLGPVRASRRALARSVVGWSVTLFSVRHSKPFFVLPKLTWTEGNTKTLKIVLPTNNYIFIIKHTTIKQACGRSGRAGQDLHGGMLVVACDTQHEGWAAPLWTSGCRASGRLCVFGVGSSLCKPRGVFQRAKALDDNIALVRRLLR